MADKRFSDYTPIASYTATDRLPILKMDSLPNPTNEFITFGTLFGNLPNSRFKGTVRVDSITLTVETTIPLTAASIVLGSVDVSLAAGTDGQELTLIATSSVDVSISAASGFSILSFNTNRSSAKLKFVAGSWRVLSLFEATVDTI